MVDRQVTKTRKHEEGDILALCDDADFWSPRAKQDAITEIESGLYRYFVSWPDGKETDIHVVQGPTGKYLRTDRDDTLKNNLDELPDC